MKRLYRILAVLVIAGLLFISGVAIDNSGSEETPLTTYYGGITAVSADCPPPEPGYPDDCNGG